MKKLSEIKEEALVLLAESDIDTVYQFLINELKDVNSRLYKDIITLKTVRKLDMEHKRKGFITTEEFVVHQNRRLYALRQMVENLDKPLDVIYDKKNFLERMYNPSQAPGSISENFLQKIFFVQVLILVGIAILIYKSYSS